MAEIPMNEGGTTSSGARPREVQIAAWLVLLESFTGLLIGGFEYYMFENELSLLGAVLALVGFWIYTQILKQDLSAWNLAVVFNVIAIFLYAVGSNWPGVGLSVICFLWLINPNTRVHFS
ncbi:MAG: hypothetical protein E4H14_12490 [Candidatus Thorarchaeota archaeon]|nr:MAG: hypothetical protein E4H14_12490 [Candidatus Thorarchaeota archaeon]